MASSNDHNETRSTTHDSVQQYLPGLIPDTVPGITHELGDPYDAKPGLGSMVAFHR